MPRNIVVCCDGTGNEFGDSNSNVVKLCSTLEVGDRQQVSYYHPGVGTMGSPNARTKLAKQWDLLRGLAFGYGVTQNISDAYRFLMETYEPGPPGERGDNIFLFGFSRGAYTVRALGGLLHMYGLLQKGNEGLIPYITADFATRTKKTQGMAHTFEVAEGFKQTFSLDVILHFVGVWDTVSSVGWITDPVKIPFTATNPIMEIGRHAISLDERRCFFRDNLWGRPLQPGDPGFRIEQDIKQVWFAGVHSDVGGSYPEGESGLSKITLEWMLHEAGVAGLRINPDEAARVLGLKIPTPFARPDATDGQHESLTAAWWPVELLPHFKYDKRRGEPHWTWPPLGEHRHMPAQVVIHQSVQDRRKEVPQYQPKTLLQREGSPPPIKVEPYTPLFPSLPARRPSEQQYKELNADEKVQAILDFKTDANPLLQAPPDEWPKFPLLALLFAVAAVWVDPLQNVGWLSWLLTKVAGWLPALLIQSKSSLSVLLVVIVFLAVWQCFRKIYQRGLIKYYKKTKDDEGGPIPPDAPKPPMPFVYPKSRAGCELATGLLAGFMVGRHDKDYLWYVAAVMVFLALGLLRGAATLARAKAFNALLMAWAEVSATHEYREYQRQLTQRRRE